MEQRQGGNECVIPAGEAFTTSVVYHGTPELLYTIGFPLGWVDAGDITFVVAEPDAARTWFPANDHPADKAAFTFRVTVPAGLTVAANGTLVDTIENGGTTTFVWDLPQPMATYLATVVIGDLVRLDRVSPNGVPLRDYLPAGIKGHLRGNERARFPRRLDDKDPKAHAGNDPVSRRKAEPLRTRPERVFGD